MQLLMCLCGKCLLPLVVELLDERRLAFDDNCTTLLMLLVSLFVFVVVAAAAAVGCLSKFT